MWAAPAGCAVRVAAASREDCSLPRCLWFCPPRPCAGIPLPLYEMALVALLCQPCFAHPVLQPHGRGFAYTQRLWSSPGESPSGFPEASGVPPLGSPSAHSPCCSVF